MPGYIGYRPQFNPISLQEYLTVPMMLQQEFDTYEDKYNENLDKLAALEAMTDDSTKYLTDRYRDRLSNAADIIAGKSGSLSDLRAQTNAARQYYRETAPVLTNAYARRQEDIKAQKELMLKDPSAVTTQIGNMQSYIDSQDNQLFALSGDKIFNDMFKVGEAAAKDFVKNNLEKGKGVATGHLIDTKITGYTPEQQAIYRQLVQAVLYGVDDQGNTLSKEDILKADNILKNSTEFNQPYQVLSKYIEDNQFNRFNDEQKNYILNRALSGQLMGMTGSTDVKYMNDKVWDKNAAFENWKRQKEYEWDNDPSKQPTIDLRQNRGTYINQYDENQDNALEKMSKTVTRNGQTINPIQARRTVDRLDKEISLSEQYQRLLTRRGSYLVDHPEYKGKDPSKLNRNAPANKEYFKIIDAINEFETKHKGDIYVTNRSQLSNLKSQRDAYKKDVSDILYSEKKLKEYGDQLGFDPNSKEEDIYSNLKTNNRIYIGTNINASNAAGRTLKDDISGSLTQTISANPSNLKRAVKSIGNGNSEKLEDILVVSEDSSTGQKSYGGNDYHITIESIIDESIATTGKQLKKNKNKNNIYLIPAQMFGSQAVSAMRNSLEQLNIDENGNQYIVGFDPSVKSHREALIDLYERNGLEEIVKNTVAASIHSAYGYNFFQSQPNTSTK